MITRESYDRLLGQLNDLIENTCWDSQVVRVEELLDDEPESYEQVLIWNEESDSPRGIYNLQKCVELLSEALQSAPKPQWLPSYNVFPLLGPALVELEKMDEDIFEEWAKLNCHPYQNHPEKWEGEVYLCNVQLMDSDCIRYSSKRLGRIALDTVAGEALSPEDRQICVPVFVNRDELRIRLAEGAGIRNSS